jgi:hypothetical protein
VRAAQARAYLVLLLNGALALEQQALGYAQYPGHRHTRASQAP